MARAEEPVMRRMQRIVLLVALTAIMPALAGCSSFDPDNWDFFGLNEKKKLPGDRKPLFPEGVPGVSQGIPPEFVKGNQPPADGADTAQVVLPAEPSKAAAAVPADEQKPKKRKPKVAKQKLIPDQSPRAAQGQQPAAWPTSDQQQPQQQPQQQSGGAAWPSNPSPGTVSR
jgi:hypothetical protein